jgi:hypothetical protein
VCSARRGSIQRGAGGYGRERRNSCQQLRAYCKLAAMQCIMLLHGACELQ